MQSTAGKQVRPIEALSLFVLVVFTTELAVMELFSPLFSELGHIPAALVDAGLLVTLSSIPLWILLSPAFDGQAHYDDQVRRNLFRGFVLLVAVFFMIEFALMLSLSWLMVTLDPHFLWLADAGLTVLLSTPLLWWLLSRLERTQNRLILTDLIDSPLLLYLLLLYVIFLASLLQGLIHPVGASYTSHGPGHVVNAVILTLIVAPFLWLFVARPLRRTVQIERLQARVIYEQVIDAVILADGQGKISALNPAALRIFGFSQGELLGQPLDILVADTQRRLDPLLDMASSNAAQSNWVSREIFMRKQHNDLCLMDVSVSRIFLGGRHDYLLILRDISERKEAERALRESDNRFREIFEQSEDGILFIKPETSFVVDANTTVELLFGYQKAEMRSDGIKKLFKGNDYKRVRQALSTLQRGKMVQLDQLDGLRRDGSECIVSLRAKFISIQGVELVYCTLRDVSERVRMEREARDIQLRLLQANKMTSLGLLVSGVAHEINNPNNLIMTNAQLLAGARNDALSILRKHYAEHGEFLLGGIPFSELEEQLPHLLNGITDASQRIARIVGNLKSYARSDPSGMETRVDLNQVAIASIALLQHELNRSTERFECNLASNLPPILGNSQQLGQVVINLLINACQALPSRKNGIRLETSCDAENNLVMLTVADEGVGIIPENGLRIMEPFFTTRLDRGGTGLGLSICRSIVSEHRGLLEYISTPGEGSAFTIKIPVTPDAAKELTHEGHSR